MSRMSRWLPVIGGAAAGAVIAAVIASGSSSHSTVTTTVVKVASRGPEKVSTTAFGGLVRVAPVGGEIDTSVACACAAPANSATAAAAANHFILIALLLP